MDFLYISQSKLKNGGRGVFAAKNFKKGELIESCPIIEIPQNNLEILCQTILINYIFFFGKNKEKSLIALGFGSLYNHTYSPNARYKIKSRQKLIEFTAIKDIKKDEEITTNYIQDNNDSTPLWFEV